MAYRITDTERIIITQFKNSIIPSVFKFDDTDNLLFIELVDFDVCDILLNEKYISESFYNLVIKGGKNQPGYDSFIKNTNIQNFKKDDLDYYNKCLQVIEVFKKYGRSASILRRGRR